MTAAVAAAPAAGGSSGSAPVANGATSGTTAPAPGTESVPQTPAQGAPSATKPPTPEQPWKAKRKLKIGGKDEEIEYDDRRLQILEHNMRRKAEIDAKEADLNDRFKRLQDDPDGLFAEAGFDVDRYLEQKAARKAQMERLTPEQQENLALKEKIAKFERDTQAKAEAERVAAEQAENQAFIQSNVQRLGEAIRLSGLPRSGELLRLYSEVQEMAHHAGEPEMSAEQVAFHGERLMAKRMATLLASVKNEGWRNRNGPAVKELIAATFPEDLPPDVALNLLGPKRAMAIVKALHAKTRTSPVPIIQEPAPVNGERPTPTNGTQRSEWDILDGLSAH